MRTTINILLPSIACDLYRGIFSLQALLLLQKLENRRTVAKSVSLGNFHRPSSLIDWYARLNYSRLSRSSCGGGRPRLIAQHASDEEFLAFVENQNLNWKEVLIGAIDRESVDRIRVVLERPNFKRRVSPVVLRNATKNIEILKFLVDWMVEVKIVFEFDHFRFSLMRAALLGNDTLIEWLVEKASEHNFVFGGNDFAEAMAKAAEGGHPAIVLLMIDKATALRFKFRAAHFGTAIGVCSNEPTISLLIEKARQNRFKLRFEYLREGFGNAIYNQRVDQMRLLIELASQMGRNFTAAEFGYGLRRGADRGDIDMVRLAISNLEPRKWCMKILCNALMSASLNGNIEILVLLLEFAERRKYLLRNIDYRTVLVQAASAGHNDIVELICTKALDNEHRIKRKAFGDSFNYAITNGYLDTAALLLEKIAQFGHQFGAEEFGEALRWATQSSQYDSIRFIFERSGVDMRDKFRDVAVHAAHSGMGRVADALRQYL